MDTRQGSSRRSLLVMAPLLVVMAAYALLPEGLVREIGNPVTGMVCISVAFWGLLRAGRPRPSGWVLVLSGFLGWVLGDLVFMVEQTVLEISAYPAPSDVVYLGSYALLAAGLVVIVRRRGSLGDLPAVLDAAILATGTAVVAGVFVISPIAGDSSLTLLGKLTSAVYPIADVLLLGILARLWTTPGARTAAFKMLAAALALTLLGDAFYNFTALTSGDVTSLVVNDLFWLGSYVLIAGAAWSPSVHDLAGPHPGREDLSDPTKRMAVLTAGLLLPAFALLGDTAGRRGHLGGADRHRLDPARDPGPGPDGGAALRRTRAGRPAVGPGPVGRPDRGAQPPHPRPRAVPGLPGGPR